MIIDRTFFDDRLKLSYTSMMDVASYEKISGISGSLSELRLEYTMATNLEGLISLTRVSGSNNHPDGENYPFKRMEDFSHIRFELKYFF